MGHFEIAYDKNESLIVEPLFEGSHLTYTLLK
jgi:hypothetical protein